MRTRPTERGVRAPSGRRRLVLFTLAAAAGFAAGCGVPPTRGGFIEALAKDNRQLARSTRAFRTAILPLKTGQDASAAQVRSGFQEMDKALKDAHAAADDQLLPPSSSSAKDLLDAYKEYLSAEDDILQNDFQKIVDEVELKADDGGRPTNAERWDVINGLLDDAGKKDAAAFSKVEQAQTAYASEHSFQLEGLAAYEDAQKKGKQ